MIKNVYKAISLYRNWQKEKIILFYTYGCLLHVKKSRQKEEKQSKLNG